MEFKNFGLSPQLLKALTEKGYTTPTAIQAQAIPQILEGKDLLAGSQTGTGKTAGFVLPLLQNLMKKPKEKGVRAIILTPTRELALQVAGSVNDFAKYLPLKFTAVFGGVNIYNQIKTLNRGCQIVVATPGRLLDLMNRKAINLSNVEIVVLDEADRMLDMGFLPDIRRILQPLPESRQSLLFSATFSPEIKQLAGSLLQSPITIQATKQNSTVDSITQIAHPVDTKRKAELLSTLITTNNWQQVLVFMRTKHSANRLSDQLNDEGIKSVTIHGNKSQGARTKALKDFKNGTVRILVATDVAARGLDIQQLPHVINFDLPNVAEDYIHRIGRTGRAGNQGEAISLVSVDESKYLRDIERLMKFEIPKVVVPGFEPDPTIKAKPISLGRRNGPKNRAGFKGKSEKPQSPRGPKKFAAKKGFRKKGFQKTKR